MQTAILMLSKYFIFMLLQNLIGIWLYCENFMTPTEEFVSICWFVTTITQKLLNRFPQNLDGGRFSVQNRTL